VLGMVLVLVLVVVLVVLVWDMESCDARYLVV
jgi:hypothetical protein